MLPLLGVKNLYITLLVSSAEFYKHSILQENPSSEEVSISSESHALTIQITLSSEPFLSCY